MSRRSSKKRMRVHKAKKRAWKSENAKWRTLPPTTNQAAVLARHGFTANTRGQASDLVEKLPRTKGKSTSDVRRLGVFAR